jgi:hypothetical protein
MGRVMEAFARADPADLTRRAVPRFETLPRYDAAAALTSQVRKSTSSPEAIP